MSDLGSLVLLVTIPLAVFFIVVATVSAVRRKRAGEPVSRNVWTWLVDTWDALSGIG